MFDYTDCPEVSCNCVSIEVCSHFLNHFFTFLQSGPVLPGTHSVERYLIEEHLHQIITRHHNERKELLVSVSDRFSFDVPA